MIPYFGRFRQAARRSSCLREHTQQMLSRLRIQKCASSQRSQFIHSSFYNNYCLRTLEISNTMSYLIADSPAEARLICLRRFRQEDGHTPWQVTNSPGIQMSELQYPRRVPREVLEMGSQVDDVVNCLTNFINDRHFQAKIDSKTAGDNVIQWTEWQVRLTI